MIPLPKMNPYLSPICSTSFSNTCSSAPSPRRCLSTSSNNRRGVSPLMPSELAIVFMVPPRRIATSGIGCSP